MDDFLCMVYRVNHMAERKHITQFCRQINLHSNSHFVAGMETLSSKEVTSERFWRTSTSKSETLHGCAQNL